MTRYKAVITSVCVLVSVLIAVVLFDTARVIEISGNVAANQERDTQALCAFRNDLQTRVTTGVDYLLTHPKGIAGISAATLRVSLVAEQHTLAALHPLVCPN